MKPTGHTGRRLRQRWDALLATAGVAIGVVLCASSVASIGWVWWRQELARREIAAVTAARDIAVLKLAAESAFSGNDLTESRRRLAQVAVGTGLSEWKLSLPDGRLLAAGNSALPLIDQLPESWESTASREADTPSDGRAARASSTVSIGARGGAILTGAAPIIHAAPWRDPTILGLAGAGASVALAWAALCRRARSRVAGVVLVCDALRSEAAGESSAEELRIDERLGEEALAWNAMVVERESSRRRELEERAARVLNASSGGESASELSGLCDAMWIGLLIVDVDSRIAYCNGAAATLLNGKREDMIGRPSSECLIDETVGALLAKAVTGGCRGRVLHEKEMETPGAGKSTLKYSVKSLRKDDFGAAFVVIEDITQQKVAEESRHSFAAQVTHELRTPLTNMRLYVETLVEDETNDPQVRARCLNVLSSEVRRLERVVTDMLSVSEMEAGSITLRSDDVRMDALLEEVEADHKPTALDKEIAVHFDLPPKLPVIDGDRDKIAMALHNLLGNAIKYTPAGGDVRVIVTEENGQLVIMVKDNGIGIKPEESELIFEKFYRAKDKRINGITGSGLGLAIARQVVRMHGGDITVSSQVDKGSTFTMTIPLGRAQAAGGNQRLAA